MATRQNTNRVRFTKGRVEGFECPARQSEAFLWDTESAGLGLRVRAGGSKQYVFQGRLHGRTLRLTIGKPAAWDIDEARTEARRLRVLVDNGVDPRDEKAEREQAAEAARQEKERGVVTLGDAWDAYVKVRRADWSEHHAADHDKAMQAPGQPRKRSHKVTGAGALWPLRDERLADLTADRLAEWLNLEKAKRPTVAARAYRLLRACLTWAEGRPEYRGLVAADAVTNTEVRRAVPKPRARGDVLQREQLAPWFDAVRMMGNSVVSAYLQALLLTGARREEMGRLRWEDVDFQWRSLTIRDKVEGERVIPLTPYMAHLLAALPRRNEWIFSSPTAKAGRLMDGNHSHTRVLAAAGLPHLTLHDLRRSFGTLSEWVECPVGVVAQIQGHKPTALAEKHYRRRPLDLLRLWHTKIEAWILDQAGIDQPAEDEQPASLRVVDGRAPA
ncbi:site-specific integrase [Thioalkalivibrio sp. HL-Eb18]|uniref:tyrosine-type recombinase/integrase n=1 Tax=Thioalkalivibrio sp. HL-Eb18 TaxID=1266913 RepID=UPI00036BD366|nr:tyrosine-type recombinase/integrase [Thioalkalivibrio sp. HL-Eb18]